MANNYTQFSFEIPLTKEQGQYLIDQIDKEDENGDTCGAQAEAENSSTWIYSEEGCDMERLFQIIAECLDVFASELAVWVEWANTCSKMRVGEFGGGGARITREGVEWFIPWQQMREKYPG